MHKKSYLYISAVLGSFLGAIMPPLSLLSKISSSNDFWYRKVVKALDLQYTDYEWLRIFPSWHNGAYFQFEHDLYLRWSVYGLISLVLLFLFQARIDQFLFKIQNSLRENKKILFFSCFIIFSYQSNFFYGWWFKGIGGWDFRNFSTTSTEIFHNFEESPKYLSEAVHWNNAKKLQKKIGDFSLNGTAIIAFNQNNQSFPINWGLLEIVFPTRFVNIDEIHSANKQLLIDLINYKIPKLDSYQKYYPEHSPYMALDFKGIEKSKIYRIEYWNIQVCAQKEKYWINKATLKHVYE